MSKEIRSIRVAFTTARDTDADEVEVVVGCAVAEAMEQLYNDRPELFACSPDVI